MAGEAVRTIFVLGFPADVKERELQNLLRWWPGYEASQMNFKGDQPMGFALFATPAMAMAARDGLQNLVFEAESNAVLRSEMAKKNLFVKPEAAPAAPAASPPAYEGNKRARTAAAAGGDYAGQFHASAGPSWAAAPSYAAPSASYEQYGGAYTGAPVAPTFYSPVQNTKDNPPCNTLFIGNLGEAASDAELRGLFSGQPGFKQMKVLRQGKSTVCFIEFGDVGSAMTVHRQLQGAVLSTSDRGGMRIQYSKNPYGRRKEGAAPGGPQRSDRVPGLVSLGFGELTRASQVLSPFSTWPAQADD